MSYTHNCSNFGRSLNTSFSISLMLFLYRYLKESVVFEAISNQSKNKNPQVVLRMNFPVKAKAATRKCLKHFNGCVNRESVSGLLSSFCFPHTTCTISFAENTNSISSGCFRYVKETEKKLPPPAATMYCAKGILSSRIKG